MFRSGCSSRQTRSSERSPLRCVMVTPRARGMVGMMLSQLAGSRVIVVLRCPLYGRYPKALRPRNRNLR
uniref:Uncharacterized protein n=1 Tax=uncultured marine virus TaxID=186617 RepID=A0A0F7L3V0_9VIRU|nr:hypothetical protein [uncultured marine virus]